MRKPRRQCTKIRVDLNFIKSIRGIQDHHLEKTKDINVINKDNILKCKAHLNPLCIIRQKNSLPVKQKSKKTYTSQFS